jgi:hypothetical protein
MKQNDIYWNLQNSIFWKDNWLQQKYNVHTRNNLIIVTGGAK